MKRLVMFLLPLFICIIGFKYIAKADELQGVTYSAHVQNVGWQNNVTNGADAGTTGRGLRVEALKIQLINPIGDMKIRYQAHVQNIGWQNWVENGQVSGTSGQSLRVEALRIQLVNAPGYDVQYQVHVQNIGWQDWVKNGDLAGTTGRSLRIEAIRIRIVKSGTNTVVGSQGNSAGSPTPTGSSINYTTFTQSLGWKQSSDGGTSGAPGQGLRIESLNISNNNLPSGVQVAYQTHIQNVGWTSWANGGQNSGTPGSALRMEGVRIKLTGAVGDYHVIYKTYVQDRGWQGWLSDGQISGYIGRSLRIEGIMIKIVRTSELANYVRPKVAIDIGHNAPYDSGSTGLVQEDVLTMEVGKKVISKLNNLGYTVIDTLPPTASSTSDSLVQRSTYANVNEVGRFVCIHFNVFNGDAHGSEVYYQTNSDLSRNLATSILNNLVNLGFTNRGIKTANYAVLRNTVAPAVLIEGCFIDNQGDMSKYNSDAISDAIVNGLVSNYN